MADTPRPEPAERELVSRQPTVLLLAIVDNDSPRVGSEIQNLWIFDTHSDVFTISGEAAREVPA